MRNTYFYQEITCLPDPEISIGFLMGKVMDAIHLGLVNLSNGEAACPVGLSFPEYRNPEEPPVAGAAKVPIGSRLRVFSRVEEDLHRLDVANILRRFSDYIHWTSVRLLERRITGYAVYNRCQPKSSKERLIRRQMKRKGISEAEAKRHYATFEPRYSKLPYLNVHSHSTGERFKLYVDRCEVAAESDLWGFTTYGLSANVTVPQF